MALLMRVRVAAALCALLAGTAAAENGLSKEYHIKAAFLYNFVKFIEWPAHAFAGPASPLVLAVSCPDAVDVELARIVKGRNVEGRSIVVRAIARAEDARAAHLLFVCEGHDGRFEELRAAIAGAAVVTVGESEPFRAAGGMISFVIVDDRVRFEINMAPADAGGIKISAQLQKLATAVRRQQ